MKTIFFLVVSSIALGLVITSFYACKKENINQQASVSTPNNINNRSSSDEVTSTSLTVANKLYIDLAITEEYKAFNSTKLGVLIFS